MWEQIWETAINSGLWAMLFVALFAIQIKDSKTRETKYQNLINSLADKLSCCDFKKRHASFHLPICCFSIFSSMIRLFYDSFGYDGFGLI